MEPSDRRQRARLCESLVWIVIGALSLFAPQQVIAAESGIQHSEHVPEGYELFHHDEFDDEDGLDEDKWYPYFLPHWSEASRIDKSQARYQIDNGILKLQTYRSEQPGPDYWSRYDNNIKSAIMTGMYSGAAGSQDGLHTEALCKHYVPGPGEPPCGVWAGVPGGDVFANQQKKLAVTRYGYFELKAKACPRGYCAWWMLGFEDDPAKSGEIDILEINHDFATDPAWQGHCAHFGMQKWADPNLTNSDHHHYSATPDCQPFPPYTTCSSCESFLQWRVYGLLWTPDRIALYIDGELEKEFPRSPDYEMVTVLDVANGPPWNHPGLPGNLRNQFQIEYFRIYKNPRIANSVATMVGGNVLPPHVAQRAVDGDSATYAQSHYGDAWDLEVDLLKLHSIERITYEPDVFNYATKFSFQASHEPSGDNSWQTLVSVANGDENPFTFALPSPKVARRVRLLVDEENGATHSHAIRELTVAGWPNLAEGRPTAMYGGNPLDGQHVSARAVDGQRGTYAQGDREDWDLEIQLADEATVERVIYRPNWANYATSFALNGRREAPGSPWEVLVVVSDTDFQSEHVLVLPEPMKLRNLVLDVFEENVPENGNKDYPHAVHEIEVYGIPE